MRSRTFSAPSGVSQFALDLAPRDLAVERQVQRNVVTRMVDDLDGARVVLKILGLTERVK